MLKTFNLGVPKCFGQMDTIHEMALGWGINTIALIWTSNSSNAGIYLLCCSSGTRKWWTGLYLGKKHDGAQASYSSYSLWRGCFMHRYQQNFFLSIFVFLMSSFLSVFFLFNSSWPPRFGNLLRC